FMFMKPSDPRFGGPDWQIAKGRVEGDDDNITTALREGEEELGLKEDNINYVSEMGMYLGRTSVFVCFVKNKNDFGHFHYETGDVIWLTLKEFEEHGRDLHKPIVRAAEEFILRTHQMDDTY